MSDTTTDVTGGKEHHEPDNGAAPDISPSVRRLLRQYDIDIRTIRGTGPDGKVRPGDVLAIVGNPNLTPHAPGQDAGAGVAAVGIDRKAVRARTTAGGDALPSISGTTVFTCNMSRVLAHRSRTGTSQVSIACYVTSAALAAAASLPLTADAAAATVRLIVSGATGDSVATLAGDGRHSPAAIQESFGPEGGAMRAGLTIRHHGLPGSLIDFCPPGPDDELAVLCVGGLQRTIGLTVTDGTQTPRVITQCQLALCYRSEVVEPGKAARFVAECVRRLESWPVPKADGKPAAD